MAGGEGVAEHIRSLELRLLDPEVRASSEALAPLLADDFLEFGSSGRVFDKTGITARLVGQSGPELSLDDFAARRLAPDVVLATYRARIRGLGSAERHSLRSSVWIRRNGRWQMLFHQGTPTAGTSSAW
jgi:hypothetical protein